MTQPADTLDKLIEDFVPDPRVIADWDQIAATVGWMLREWGIDTDDPIQLRAIAAGLLLNDWWNEYIADPTEKIQLRHHVMFLAHGAKAAAARQELS